MASAQIGDCSGQCAEDCKIRVGMLAVATEVAVDGSAVAGCSADVDLSGLKL